MKFQRDPDTEKAVARLVEATIHLRRGDLVAYGAIEEATGEGFGTSRWQTVVRKWKRSMLRDRDIDLRTVRGVGYRLCTHEEQLTVMADDRLRYAHNDLRRARDGVGALPAGELTDHQAALRAFRLKEIGQQRRSLRQSRVKQVLYSKRKPPPGLSEVA